MSDYALSFITDLAPAKKIQVDGEAYDLLGLDHQSPDDEAEVAALFARFGVLQSDLEMTTNLEKGKALALKVQACRIQILTKLTTMPKDVAMKLHLTQQVALMELLSKENEAEDASEE